MCPLNKLRANFRRLFLAPVSILSVHSVSSIGDGSLQHYKFMALPGPVLSLTAGMIKGL